MGGRPAFGRAGLRTPRGVMGGRAGYLVRRRRKGVGRPSEAWLSRQPPPPRPTPSLSASEAKAEIAARQ
jgi:hypothetical protein